MYVKRGFPNYLLFVKIIYYSNQQLIVHGKVDHSILVMENEFACIQSICVKGDINLDIAQKEHEI